MIDLGMFALVLALGIWVRSYLNRARPWFRVVITLGRDLSGSHEVEGIGIGVVREQTTLVWDSYLNWKEVQRHVPMRGDSWGEYQVENVDIVSL